MNFLRSLIVAGVLAILGCGSAQAQCGTTAPANKFCGNDTGSSALATWKTIPAGALSPIAGGTVLGNRTGVSAVPTALTNPVLGIPGTSTGEVGLAGATSGTVTLRAQAAAGSAVVLLPTSAGTLVGTASSPLVINSTTGLMSITGLAGGVLSGAGPAFTMTPALGATGVATGSIAFNGFTSGGVVVTPQSVAGTPTLTLPNTSGTFAVGASTPLVLSATTGGLTCPTCVTSSGGGAITGTAPISVSGAGVVSINAPYTTLSASNGGIVYSGSTNLAILAGTATAGQIVRSGSSAAPSWSTATYPATTSAGTVLASASANTVAATSTPVLGVAGSTVGSIGFQNATSGTVTLQPVTGALGTVTINIPAAAGTMAVSASSPLSLSAAGAVSIPSTTGSGSTVVLQTSPSLITPALGVATATSLAIGGCTIGSNQLCAGSSAFGGAVVITSNSAAALAVGANGTTNPALLVDASTASSATGLSIKSAAAAGGVALATISSATNDNLFINGKGTGGVNIGGISTGGVNIGSGGGGVAIAAPLSGSAFGTNVTTALATTLSAAGGLTSTIASGTAALGTSAISSAACASVVTVAATNTATTDVVTASFNGDPTAVTGYVPSTSGMLTIFVYPTANNVNFKVCNNTGSSVTPGAITLNWRVVR